MERQFAEMRFSNPPEFRDSRLGLNVALASARSVPVQTRILMGGGMSTSGLETLSQVSQERTVAKVEQLVMWLTRLPEFLERDKATIVKCTRDMALAAKDSQTRAGINGMLSRNPQCAMYLMTLVNSTDEAVVQSTLQTVHNLLLDALDLGVSVQANFLLLDRHITDQGGLPREIVIDMINTLCSTEMLTITTGWSSTMRSAENCKNASSILRFLICSKWDVWEALDPETQATLFGAFAMLISSKEEYVFEQAAATIQWLLAHQSNVLERVVPTLPSHAFIALQAAIIHAHAQWPLTSSHVEHASIAQSPWNLLIFLARVPRVRYRLLQDNAGAELNCEMNKGLLAGRDGRANSTFAAYGIGSVLGWTRQELEAQKPEWQWTREAQHAEVVMSMLTHITEMLHSPACAERAITVLQAFVEDASNMPQWSVLNKSAEALIMLHDNPGALILSTALCVRDYSGINNSIADKAQSFLLKLMASDALTKWVSSSQADHGNDERVERVVHACLSSLIVLVHDFAAPPSPHSLNQPDMVAPAGAGMPTTHGVIQPIRRNGVLWLLRFSVELVHALCTAVSDRLLARLMDDVYELMHGLASAVMGDELDVAQCAAESLGILAAGAPLLAGGGSGDGRRGGLAIAVKVAGGDGVEVAGAVIEAAAVAGRGGWSVAWSVAGVMAVEAMAVEVAGAVAVEVA
ncbi:hypothetical protein CYMTET_4466 [Cymbomonas tetramitiformis]|uniref:Uncharacterized protein n=1 Tax=Cymbomonas tetramitiformis TaxID=36881 RepID=A0AAE0LKG8_9CHLO|nr:hypothetical protein CYMTET_4466 [Cymbomonas tetramitiformis]